MTVSTCGPITQYDAYTYPSANATGAHTTPAPLTIAIYNVPPVVLSHTGGGSAGRIRQDALGVGVPHMQRGVTPDPNCSSITFPVHAGVTVWLWVGLVDAAALSRLTERSVASNASAGGESNPFGLGGSPPPAALTFHLTTACGLTAGSYQPGSWTPAYDVVSRAEWCVGCRTI